MLEISVWLCWLKHLKCCKSQLPQANRVEDNEVALAEALLNGMIDGLAICVLSQEPTGQGDPLLELNLPHLIVTPHIAWASRESQENLAEQLISNLEAFVAGVPRNVIVE